MNQEQGIALLVTFLMTLWSFLVLVQILSGESSLLRISAASTGLAGFLGLLAAIVFSVLRGDSASSS